MNYPAMQILLSWIISIACATEGTPSPIEQAHALALLKNRQEASAVLIKAIGSATPKSRVKLIDVLNTITKVFFTDKGQRMFEAGQAGMFDSPDLALGQFREALKLEDENILILDNIARVQLQKQDCAGALSTLKTARALNPFLPDPAVLELRALVCLKDYETFREKLKSLPAVEKGQEPYVQYLTAQDLLQQQMWRRATEVLSKVSEDQPRFPETYYFLYKASVGLENNGEAYAQKYVSLCKSLSPRERKQFSNEPRLCLNLKETEDELAKKNSEP